MPGRVQQQPVQPGGAGTCDRKPHEGAEVGRFLEAEQRLQGVDVADFADSLETLLGFEEAAYFGAFMWLAIAGPGAASLDRLLLNATGHGKELT